MGSKKTPDPSAQIKAGQKEAEQYIPMNQQVGNDFYGYSSKFDPITRTVSSSPKLDSRFQDIANRGLNTAKNYDSLLNDKTNQYADIFMPQYQKEANNNIKDFGNLLGENGLKNSKGNYAISQFADQQAQNNLMRRVDLENQTRQQLDSMINRDYNYGVNPIMQATNNATNLGSMSNSNAGMVAQSKINTGSQLSQIADQQAQNKKIVKIVQDRPH